MLSIQQTDSVARTNQMTFSWALGCASLYTRVVFCSTIVRMMLLCSIVFSTKAVALDYALFGVDNCFLHADQGGRTLLLRCPIPAKGISQDQNVRVRLYTLPKQTADQCYLAGSTHLATTYYRFSRFSEIKDLQRPNEGLVYEAKLGGKGFFVSPSEGETWKLNYEVQCPMHNEPILHSYSVIRTHAYEAWAMN